MRTVPLWMELLVFMMPLGNVSYTTIFPSDKELKVKAKFFRLSHDVVTCDVDHNVSTAYC